MLTFEWNEQSGELEVFLDADGYFRLMRSVQSLEGYGDHDHLMTEDWEGPACWELDNTKQGADTELIHMATIIIPHFNEDDPDNDVEDE